MTLDTFKVRDCWYEFSKRLKAKMPELIKNEIEYFVYETAAAGNCADEDEDFLFEILNDMAQWRISTSYDVDKHDTNSW
tara:strand:+ start:11248 stop:11484 length:237 start_codon:yes stop_codon:yes gene_type:complete